MKAKSSTVFVIGKFEFRICFEFRISNFRTSLRKIVNNPVWFPDKPGFPLCFNRLVRVRDTA